MKVGLREREKAGDKKPTRYFSKKQEKTVAKEFDGRTTPNSGATKFAKGDIKLDNFLLECKTKTTHAESISIKKEWLEKIKQEALFMGKDNSALIFNFGPDECNYVILEENLFKELLDLINN